MTKFNKTFKEIMESVKFEDLQKEYLKKDDSKKAENKSKFLTKDECKKTFQDAVKKIFEKDHNKDGKRTYIKAYFRSNDFNDRDCWIKYEEAGKTKELSIKIDEIV